MKLLRLIHFVIDLLIKQWPSAAMGMDIRLFFWKVRFYYCGFGVRFGENLTISNFSAISIGEKSNFMSGSYLYANDNGTITIGSCFSCNHNVFIGASCGEIIIGDDVLIGPNVVLRAVDHVFTDPFVPIRLQGHKYGKITIEDNVWIGANVVVTSNVRIGKGVVVGAGSVVTKDLPAMTICVGVPARPIRSRLESPNQWSSINQN